MQKYAKKKKIYDIKTKFLNSKILKILLLITNVIQRYCLKQ